MIENWLGIGEIPALASALDVQVLKHSSEVKDIQLSLEVVVTRETSEKSLVCALYGLQGDNKIIDFRESSWPYSKGLNAAYQYLPRIESSTRLNLRPFRSEDGFRTLLVALFPWGKSISNDDARLGRCYGGVPMNLDGRSMTAFYVLRRAEEKDG